MIDDPVAINAIRARIDETYLAETTLAKPTKYDIAVSVVCDIKCPYCPRQKLKEEVVSGYLKAPHFDPVTPYLPYSQRTGLYGLGEPFLNKNFFEYLAAAKTTGSYTMTSSHGMSLKPEIAQRIIDMGLDELAVSMDGCTAKTFNFLRSGADFDTVVANVSRLIKMRNEQGKKLPRVHIACAVSKHNVWEMTGMVMLAKKMGADRLVFSNIIFVKKEDAHINVTGTKTFRVNWAAARRLGKVVGLETLYFYQKPFPWLKDEEMRPIREGQRFGCPSAWQAYIVERDGNLKPCCYLNGSLGNSQSQTGGDFADNFNNDAAKELRKTFLTGDLRTECRECGMLQENSPGHVRRCLTQARDMIAEGDFSPGVRAELLKLANKYEDLAREAFGRAWDADEPPSSVNMRPPAAIVGA